ncbi:hypothetical protein HC864_01345 [Candidatus Gracilibacteria bacterium]|nr:hypothetical protein [Candidatus Gracilibacteria bacterium]
MNWTKMNGYGFGYQRSALDYWIVRGICKSAGIAILFFITLLIRHNIIVQYNVEQKSILKKLYPYTLSYDIDIYYGFVKRTKITDYGGLRDYGYGLFEVNQKSYNYCDYSEDNVSRIFFEGINKNYEKIMILNAMDILCSDSQKQKLQIFMDKYN